MTEPMQLTTKPKTQVRSVCLKILNYTLFFLNVLQYHRPLYKVLWSFIIMFSGSIVALVTPMQHNQVDIERLRFLVNFHIQQGTQAIVAAGTTGESGTLTDAEKKLVIQHVIDEARERVPVIAGTAYPSTQHTIELTQMAMELGADAALIMTPAFIKPTQEGLFQHYSHIATEAPLPIILYNVPGRTACDLLPETIGRLAAFANIIGVKEATGDLSRIEAIKKAVSEHSKGELDLFSGDDITARDFMRQGGKGVISVTANVVPELMLALCQASLNHEEERADELQAKLLPLHQALFLEANPIPTKWALTKMGLISEEIRLPLTVLSLKHQATLSAAMQAAGCL
jgi:4-hydroxy-tetrahydrodipicolinate synthase